MVPHGIVATALEGLLAGRPTRRPARQQALERGEPGIEMHPPWITGSHVARVLDVGVEAFRQVDVERRLRGQPGNGYDAALGGGEVERPPGARDRGPEDGGVGHEASLAHTTDCYTPREYEHTDDR